VVHSLMRLRHLCRFVPCCSCFSHCLTVAIPDAAHERHIMLRKQPVCRPACFSAYLSICLPACLSVCLSVCICVCVSACHTHKISPRSLFSLFTYVHAHINTHMRPCHALGRTSAPASSSWGGHGDACPTHSPA